jgi:hypothetical protein
MPWADLIAALVALVFIAAALRIAFATPTETLRVRAKAEEKALQLLLSNLTPQQCQQYHAFGHFDVIGSMTRTRYRIYHGTSRNVVELVDGGGHGPGRCFLPTGELVAGDCMLAQKIAIENYEDEVLSKAFPFEADYLLIAHSHRR